jgi:predicted transcriptional regulator
MSSVISGCVIVRIMVSWNLKIVLENYDIAPHKLAVEAGIHPPSIYRLLREDGVENVSRKTLSKVISTLRRLTNKPITVCDLLEYVEE